MAVAEDKVPAGSNAGMTPEEYQAEYEKAAAELAEKGYHKRPKAEAKPEPKEPPQVEEKKEPEPKEPAAGSTGDPAPAKQHPELEKALRELQEKDELIKGTKSWADKQLSKRDKELAQLKKELDETRKKVPQPKILEDIEDFEAGVEAVLAKKGVRATETQPEESDPEPDEETAQAQSKARLDMWNHIVLKAIPGLLAMTKEDPELSEKLTAKKKQVGADWADPITAVGHMNQVILEHTNAKAEAKLKRREENDPLRVPGGTGGAAGDGKRKEATYDDVMDESQEDFEKRIARIKNRPRRSR